LLRGYLASDGRWRLRTTIEDVPAHYLNTLIAYEDRRFYRHLGVDFFALVRVGMYLLRGHRLASGGSTLTMQVVRLLNPAAPRGIYGKVLQLFRAIALERVLSKHDILEIYLTLAPFGGNIEGVRAASLFYFCREPSTLTLKESAQLVAIAQAPTRRRPDRHPLAARQARDRVLARVGGLSADSDAAPETPLVASWPLLAAHFADRVRQ
jgi:penicillin-binding protein 1C